jgi:membrane-bound ClpP family serine protease
MPLPPSLEELTPESHLVRVGSKMIEEIDNRVYLFIFGLGSFALIDAMFEAICLNPAQWLTLPLISLILMSLVATAMVFTVNKRRKLHNHKLESAKGNMT